MPNRRAFLSQLGLLAAGAAGAWWLKDRVLWPAPKPAFAPGSQGGSGWLPLQGGYPLAAFPVTINGAPARALVDSGAQMSVLDSGFAQRTGLASSAPGVPVFAFGLSGRPQAGRGAVVDVRAGDLSLPHLHVAELDLGALADADGYAVACALGQDVLRTVVLDLDLPRRRLALRAPGAGPAPAAPAASSAASSAASTGVVAGRLSNRELIVPVEVEGHALEVVLDTGFSGTLALSQDVAQAAGLLAPGREVRWSSSVTFGGALRQREVTARTLGFGGRTFHHRSVQVFPRSDVSVLPSGLAGLGLLTGRRVLIDLARATVTFPQDGGEEEEEA